MIEALILISMRPLIFISPFWKLLLTSDGRGEEEDVGRSGSNKKRYGTLLQARRGRDDVAATAGRLEPGTLLSSSDSDESSMKAFFRCLFRAILSYIK